MYRLLWSTVGLLVKIYWPTRAVGRRNVPRGGVIIASNHRAAIDPILICMSFVRVVHWLAKVELVKNKRIAWFFRAAQVVPVDRNAPDEVWIEKAARLLDMGRMFGIFPEGTRSPDGRVYRGYTGMARLAERSGKPVVPAAIIGADRSHKKGKRLAKPVPVVVRFGRAMRFERAPGEDPKDAYHRFTEQVLDEVAELAGAERVRDRYSREPVRRAAP